MSDLSICEAYGKPFVRCRYNAHHQKYCRRPACVRRCKQARQRTSHNRRYHEDEDYRERKRQKSREYMRVRRGKEKAAKEDAIEINPIDTLTGVVAQLTDEEDPMTVRERLRSYSARGRQLSHICSITGPATVG
ncbi:hypothetical protein BVY04_00795 [bacterium M21]|nr:hypothetical protein BVY04_00795 [bacterium M21]